MLEENCDAGLIGDKEIEEGIVVKSLPGDAGPPGRDLMREAAKGERLGGEGGSRQ